MSSDFFDRYSNHLRNLGLGITGEELFEISTYTTDPARKVTAHALLGGIDRIKRIEDGLRENGERLRQATTNVELRLERGDTGGINSLGALQNTAQRYDTLCAELGTAREMLAEVAKVWKAQNEAAQA